MIPYTISNQMILFPFGEGGTVGYGLGPFLFHAIKIYSTRL